MLLNPRILPLMWQNVRVFGQLPRFEIIQAISLHPCRVKAKCYSNLYFCHNCDWIPGYSIVKFLGLTHFTMVDKWHGHSVTVMSRSLVNHRDMIPSKRSHSIIVGQRQNATPTTIFYITVTEWQGHMSTLVIWVHSSNAIPSLYDKRHRFFQPLLLSYRQLNDQVFCHSSWNECI